MLQKILDGQYRRPSGLLGRWIGRKMAQQHVPENQWTVNVLKAAQRDRILEIGFGPGLAIEQLTKIVTHGLIAGIDFSQTMLNAASQRNAQSIRTGLVELRYGDAASLPYADASFDKVYSIHSIYFWPQPGNALREICRVLKPRGTLVLTILPKEKWGADDPDKPIGTPECTPYTAEELKSLLIPAGFTSVHVEADQSSNASPSNYSVVAVK